MTTKLKKIQTVLRILFIAVVLIFTLPLAIILIGGFLSYFFNLNFIVTYQQAFGVATGKISIVNLLFTLKEFLYLAFLLSSIFLIKKGWFIKFVSIVILINYVINLSKDFNKFFFDAYFWIPAAFFVLYYIIDQKNNLKTKS